MTRLDNTHVPSLIDAAVVATGIALALGSEPAGFPDSVAVQMFIAMTVINLLDLVLPHGDSVDIDSALVIAALYLIGPWSTLFVAAGAWIVARALSGGWRRPRAVLSGVAKRTAGLMAAVPVWVLFASGVTEGSFAEYTVLLVTGLVYVLVELLYGQIAVAYLRSDSPVRMALSNLALQGPLLASGVSVAILTVIIYEGMTAWGLALMTFLLLAMRQSFALLLDVRNAYHSTVEALVGAMEAQRPGEKGIGEQVAMLARRTGAECGWFGAAVERLGYAALLHYFGLGFTSTDKTTGQERPTPLAEVRFFEPVEPIVRLLACQGLEGANDRDLQAAYIVAQSLTVLDLEQAGAPIAFLKAQLSPDTTDRIERAVERARQKVGLG